MCAIDLSQLLRPGLLEGISVLIAGPLAAAPASGGEPSEEGLGEAVASECAALGAIVRDCACDPVEEAALEVAVRTAVAELDGIDLLAVDGAGLFDCGLTSAVGQAGESAGRAALRMCLDGAWNVTRAVVNHAFLTSGGPEGDEMIGGEGQTGAGGRSGGGSKRRPGRGGRIVYLAPAPGAGELADATRAGLENLARTLSIEWARHEINVVTIALGDSTTPGEAAALTAYLASPAGAYFSGCQLDLRGVSERPTRRTAASSVTRVP
jgi:NAD(P)-dependent dehydrogenase (short-subunit alcohol dehydrogenase family)